MCKHICRGKLPLCCYAFVLFVRKSVYIYKDFKVCPTMHSANAWSQILLPSASVPCPRLKQRLCHRPKSDVCPFVSLCLCALPSRKTQIAKQVPSPLSASHRLACEEGKTQNKVHFAVMPLCPFSEKQYIKDFTVGPTMHFANDDLQSLCLCAIAVPLYPFFFISFRMWMLVC